MFLELYIALIAGSCNRLPGGVKAEEIRVILDLHNQYRARVALGQERRGRGGRPQPPAANMRQLVTMAEGVKQVYDEIL